MVNIENNPEIAETVEVPDKYRGEIRAKLFDTGQLRDLRFAGRRWRYMSARRLLPGSLYGNAGTGMRLYLAACDLDFWSAEAMVRHYWNPDGSPRCPLVTSGNPDARGLPVGMVACTVCDELVEYELKDDGAIHGIYDEQGAPFRPEIGLKAHLDPAGRTCRGNPVFATSSARNASKRASRTR